MLAATVPIHAQEVDRPVTQMQRTSGPITIDGVVDEAAWDAIEPFPLIVQGPTYKMPASQRTEMRVAFDDDYLYFSCRCYDTDPSSIRAVSYKRDAWSSSFDQVAVILDTFNDNENALVFILSSVGVRTDVAIFNDANMTANDFPFNDSWNTFWDAETSVTDEGWFGEVRIPFSSLKFNSDEGRVSMGLIAYRFHARSREVYLYPDIPPDWGFGSFLKPSQAQNVQFKGVTSRKPLYITPYVIGGVTQEYDLNEAETGYLRDDDFTRDIGLDLKYGLTNNLTVDLTVNMDFAQVEADDEQVNLTRFSLFFPEKRRFFQERSSNFDFKFGEFNQLFYSRRIGLDEDAEQRIPLLGGMRVVGRIGKWDVGFLNLHSSRNDIRPVENYGVLRLRRQIINPFSYVGGIVTSQIDVDGKYNVAYGADGIFRVAGNDYLLLNWAQTVETDGRGGIDATRIRALWEKRIYNGLSYAFTFGRVGEHYDPALGFELREDFTQISEQVAYGWTPSENSPLSQHQFTIRSDLYIRNEDQKTDTYSLGANWGGFLKNGTVMIVALQRTYDSLTESFELSDDIEIDVGKYTFSEVQLIMQTTEARPLFSMNSLNIGEFYGGTRVSVGVQPTWNLSKYVSLSGAYQYNYIDFPDLDDSFTAHVARFRAELTLNRALSVSSFVQLNSNDDEIVANFRLRYNPREGNDFYLVYNEGFHTDRMIETPRLPFSDGRTILLKYSHTFVQ